jgi:methionine synthase I (cobalamin-dependent)/5,10-methylenetetrahydrofolate reductase
MNELREYLKNNIIITDGAAGTYISSLIGRNAPSCELLNISDKQMVLRMQTQYVKAGANLIFTNTFNASAAGNSIGTDFGKTEKIITEGVKIAKQAAGDSVFIAGDIGPLSEAGFSAEELSAEYRRIADTFIENGIKNFIFETFPDSTYPIETARYIKSRLDDAFVIISFAITPEGYSRTGINGNRLIGQVKAAGCADAAGFNCCSGPAHLLNYAKTVDYGNLIPVIMPNAGYPQRNADSAEDVVTFSGSPEYFAQRLSHAADCGFRIIGGCCGTTPRHIAMLSQALKTAPVHSFKADETNQEKTTEQTPADNTDLFGAKYGKKAVIVELEPPLNADISKLESAAQLLKSVKVDAVTVADSPMARARADSVVIAAHLCREFGFNVIPHMCCRDKNINALKSSLIAAHIEGIRNVLAITGDPVSDTPGSVKSVFNLNSAGLCRFIKSLNDDIFKGSEMNCGCAFNVNARNLNAEFSRLEKKIEAGASFVLTQPVFTERAADAVAKIRSYGIKVFAGIITPVSYKNAVFLANEMPGIEVPDEIIRKFSQDMSREQGEQIGIDISVKTAEMLDGKTDGYYFIVPFHRVYVTQKIIEVLRQKGII